MFHNGSHHLPAELDAGYALTFRRLRRFFLSRGVPREEAADLAQEAIARTLLHLNRNGTGGYVGVDPLLNRIAANLLIDRARSSGPRLVSIESAEELDDGIDPSEEVARLHDYRAIRRAIGELSDRHRNALLLSLDGMSPAEIAQHFGIRRNAADALLHRARRRLADRLRVTTDVALGLVALVALRVRAAARRTSEVVRGSGSIAMSPVALNAVTFAIAAAVALPAAPVVAAAGTGTMPTRAASVARASDALGGVEGLEPPAPLDHAGTRRSSTAVDARAHRVEVEQTVPNPVTGEDEEVWARAWHERAQEGERGITGPVLDGATGAVCDRVGGVCDVAGGEP